MSGSVLTPRISNLGRSYVFEKQSSISEYEQSQYKFEHYRRNKLFAKLFIIKKLLISENQFPAITL